MVIDTSIFIEHLRSSDKANTTLSRLPDGTALYASVVTLYELYLGATTPAKRQDVDLLMGGVSLLALTPQIADRAAYPYRDLRSRNQLIGHRDLFIAATAMVHDMLILTLNQKHFSRLAGLGLA